MAEKINSLNMGYSFGGVMGLLYLLCVALFAAAPGWTLNFFKNMFHGIDITKIAADNITFGGTVLGLVETVILSFVFGCLLGIMYNYLQEK